MGTPQVLYFPGRRPTVSAWGLRKVVAMSDQTLGEGSRLTAGLTSSGASDFTGHATRRVRGHIPPDPDPFLPDLGPHQSPGGIRARTEPWCMCACVCVCMSPSHTMLILEKTTGVEM